MSNCNNLPDYFDNSLKLIQTKFEGLTTRSTLSFNVAEKQVNLLFANSILYSKLSVAFKHLEGDISGKSNLDVYVLDEECMSITLLSPPWIQSISSRENDIWVSDDSSLKILHQPAKNTLIMLNLIRGKAIYWVKSGHQIPYYESSAPFRPILHWWLGSIGAQLLHAAAVGLSDKGILLAGKGGSGKSNTAISSLDSKLYYAADDYTLLSFNPNPIAHSLFSTGKLLFDDVNRYSFLKEIQLDFGANGVKDEKALFFLYPTFQEKLIKSFPIKAVFIPKVTQSKSPQISPISASKAYLALAPSTIFQMHGERELTHKNIVRLLQVVPSFLFELSTEPQKNTEAIIHFLNSI